MPMHDMLDSRDTADRTVINLPLEVKASGLPGEFEGYGAVFGNTDRDGDVVAKGAFADSLKARLPALLWQHNAKEPIGRFDVVREDNRGLFVKGRLAQSGRGAEAYELLKMGALNGLSIGFVTKEAMRNSAAGTRTIKRADLMEVSLVTFPANELARVQTVKQRTESMDTSFETGDINDPRTFERFLREQGFSRNRAKAITAKGFKSSQGLMSEPSEIFALVKSLYDRKIALNTVTQHKCNDNCSDCAPCRKQFGASDRCQALANDIKDGNISRWKALKELDAASIQLERAVARFNRDFRTERGLDFNLDLISAAAQLVKVVKRPQNRHWLGLLASAGELILNLATYNGDLAREYKKAVGRELREVQRAKAKAENLEKLFWQQVKAHEREGCSRLSASHFNRP